MADRRSLQPSPPGEPERLVADYLGGNDAAFTRLVELYEAGLYAYLHSLTADAHLAEDVFQQTWIKVAAKAALYNGRASFSSWLYAVARNAAFDELRRLGRRPAAAPGDGMENRPDPALEHPLERLDREEEAARLRRALATLPEVQRDAFLLKEEGGLSFEEVGGILRCGRETAKSRFRLAVGKLRTIMGMDKDPEGGAT